MCNTRAPRPYLCGTMRFFTALLLLGQAVTAHICLLSPTQRGGLPNLGALTPGDDHCFHPGSCGGKPGAISATLNGLSGTTVLLEQNLNHYNPGWPGVMDVALGPTDDGPWTTLASLPDFYAHLQAKQTNFSMPVFIPVSSCKACVLRVRYMPNKPTEVPFWVCCVVLLAPEPCVTNAPRTLPATCYFPTIV